MGDGNTMTAGFAELEGYWQALRPASGGLPRREDFDPRGIAGQLRHTLLLDRIARGQVRIRLAGSTVCDLMGMDLRGMPLSALMAPEARAGLALWLEQVFDGPARLWLDLQGDRGLLRQPCTGRMLVLPMLGLDGNPDRALACLLTEGTPGRPPRRFEVTGADVQPIAGVPGPGRADSRGLAARVPPRPVALVDGLAEAPAPFTPAPARKGPPFLRLVKG